MSETTVAPCDWLNSLTEDQRQHAFAEMRALRDESDRFNNSSSAMSPRYGSIAIGGAHYDEFLKADALSCLLRYVNKGMAPGPACEKALEDAAGSVRKWNDQHKRDYTVHRSVSAVDSFLWDRARRLIRSVA